jgi:hypothetical protein
MTHEHYSDAKPQYEKAYVTLFVEFVKYHDLLLCKCFGWDKGLAPFPLGTGQDSFPSSDWSTCKAMLF